MNIAKRTGFVLRDNIVEMLTDDEVSKVSTSETAVRLAEGEEFIDLEKLEQGVLRADGVRIHVGSALPRKAVHEKTWRKIVKLLAAPPAGPGSSKSKTRAPARLPS